MNDSALTVVPAIRPENVVTVLVIERRPASYLPIKRLALPAAPRILRKSLLLKVLAWVGAVLALFGAYYGWQYYQHQAAVRVVQNAGFYWSEVGPTDLIRFDDSKTYELSTWTYKHKTLCVWDFKERDLSKIAPVLRKLQPTHLYFLGSSSLENVDGLEGLSNVEVVYINKCKALQNLDVLAGLSSLKTIRVYGCPSLQNVDAIKELPSLSWVDIHGCVGLPGKTGSELRAALPKTKVYGL